MRDGVVVITRDTYMENTSNKSILPNTEAGVASFSELNKLAPEIVTVWRIKTGIWMGIFMLAVLAFSVLLLGVWPAPLMELMEPTLGALLEHISQSKL